MRGPGTSKHCVTNMAADEEAAIAAVIAAIFLANKEEEENRETVLDLPNVLAVLYYIQRRGDTSLESRAMQRMLFPHIRYLSSRRAFACPEVHLKR